MNVSATKVMATARGSLVEKTNKEDTENRIIEGFCDILTSTNNTPIRSPDMVRRLGIVGKKEKPPKIMNGT